MPPYPEVDPWDWITNYILSWLFKIGVCEDMGWGC
jgi:hypothetical protein